MPYSGGGSITVSSNNAWTGTNSFEDADFTIVDEGDATKKLAFSVGGVTTGNTITVTPSGTAAAPVLGFGTFSVTGSGHSTYGTADGHLFKNGATELLFVASNLKATLPATGTFGFAAGATAAAAQDTFISREAAAIIQMGADVNGAAVAQTFKSHDGITGTDVAGANLTLAAGRGTGAGASGNLALQAAAGLATGTTAQTLYARQVIVGKAKALTAASATTFVTIGVASGGFTGGFIDYAIVASDGTDHQCRAGVLPFAIVNKADAETGTVGTVGAATEVVAVSAGTLTNTFTIVAATNAMDIKANAASSLTETNLDIYYTVHLNGPATVTPA